MAVASSLLRVFEIEQRAVGFRGAAGIGERHQLHGRAGGQCDRAVGGSEIDSDCGAVPGSHGAFRSSGNFRL